MPPPRTACCRPRDRFAGRSSRRSPYQYRWWVYDGTSWQMLRDWTPSSTLTWTPTTADAAYRITVWVKNADSVTTAWDGSASMPFVIQ
ncbi:MAG TPA: hypothetical protein VFB85_10235 [Vicinamibacterales bacterium]|nr:hypothetical protein [Vicinamibacterales bacterium]